MMNAVYETKCFLKIKIILPRKETHHFLLCSHVKMTGTALSAVTMLDIQSLSTHLLNTSREAVITQHHPEQMDLSLTHISISVGNSIPLF